MTTGLPATAATCSAPISVEPGSRMLIGQTLMNAPGQRIVFVVRPVGAGVCETEVEIVQRLRSRQRRLRLQSRRESRRDDPGLPESS